MNCFLNIQNNNNNNDIADIVDSANADIAASAADTNKIDLHTLQYLSVGPGVCFSEQHLISAPGRAY